MSPLGNNIHATPILTMHHGPDLTRSQAVEPPCVTQRQPSEPHLSLQRHPQVPSVAVVAVLATAVAGVMAATVATSLAASRWRGEGVKQVEEAPTVRLSAGQMLHGRSRLATAVCLHKASAAAADVRELRQVGTFKRRVY